MNDMERFLANMDTQNPQWVTAFANQNELRIFTEATIRREPIVEAYATLRKSVGDRLMTCARAQHNAQRERELEVVDAANTAANNHVMSLRTRQWPAPVEEGAAA